ncbi:MAG: hypothetical protein ABIS18_05795 [Actinomycetota bacterium]
MRNKVLAVALAAGMSITSLALASDPAGFDTTSCVYPANSPLPGSGAVRAVPSQYTTIQAAVNAAVEGDTIEISPGTYNESTNVTTPGLRIRGTDRNAVILNGGNVREVGFEITADRVVVENLTAHNYKLHAVHWTGVTGYWGRYLTAYNNGLYGLFAFGSRCGQMDHSYTSGNADSGFYIGQCFPCDAVIHNVEAIGNAIGYSGTNAGGNLTLRDSVWNDNALGIVPNSLDSEARPPQRGLTIKNNEIRHNNALDAPGQGIAALFYGGGIVIAGGQGNVVAGNTVTDNALGGVVLAPLPDQSVYIPSGNTVWGNTVTHDEGLYPDAFDLGQAASSGPNNCWADNTFGNSSPPAIQDIWSCAFTLTPPGGSPTVEVALVSGFAGLNGRSPSPWQDWPYVGPHQTQTTDLTGAVDSWLPALGLS